MAKWADYLISGVWNDNNGRITDVMLHTDSENGYGLGVKKSESEVIRLLKTRNTIITITWGYPGWKKGAKVEIVMRAGKEFLRTDPNATVKDNLDNSIDMSSFRF